MFLQKKKKRLSSNVSHAKAPDGKKFPDKQDGALSTKCAMESQFPTQSAVTALLVLKFEKLSGFISHLFILSPFH